MSSNPISTFGPSDSGFLNAFSAPQPSQPLQSRVGEEPLDCESVLEDDPLTDDETVIDPICEEDAAVDDPPLSDTQLEARLLATPLPEGFLARMRRVADES